MLYVRWESAGPVADVARVMPDGCRDIIFQRREGAPDRVLYTDWDHCPRMVRIDPGVQMVGYRLAPGLTVAGMDLAEVSEPDALVELIESAQRSDSALSEIIDALGQPGATVAAVARQNGVTARSLERYFRRSALPPPVFWRGLGRARRLANALSDAAPLADLAYAYGYSDQAHMTRSVMRWFGLTPGQLRDDTARRAELFQPGLGNWQHL